MAGYIGTKAAVSTPGAERKFVFDISTTTTSITGVTYTPNHVHVFHNGVRLVDGTDYTATTGNSITLTNAAQSGDQVVVVSYATYQNADSYTKAEADSRYVNATGDTMTGALNGRSFITADDTNNYALMAGRYSAGYGGAVINTTSNASFLELQVNGYGCLRADNAGRVTTPYQPAFWTTGNTSSFSDTVFKGTVLLNNGGYYSTSTGRFTAPVAGRYAFSFNLTTEDTNSHFSYVAVNGGNPGGYQLSYGVIYQSATQNIVVSLSAGDYVEGRRRAAGYAVYRANFSGYLIG